MNKRTSILNHLSKDPIELIWRSMTHFKPVTKRLFGKEHRLGFKYHLNKLYEQMEARNNHFSRRKQYTVFYDDLKLLKTIQGYDADRVDSVQRHVDETMKHTMITSALHPEIHKELIDRISELSFWQHIKGDKD